MAAEDLAIINIKFDEFAHDCVAGRLVEEPGLWVDHYPGGLSVLLGQLRDVCRERGVPVAYAAYEDHRPVVCWVEATQT
jgi:adenine-specific DNA methylase